MHGLQAIISMNKPKVKPAINKDTFREIWSIIEDKYDVKDWETCSESKLDRAERLELKMHSAFILIKDMVLGELQNKQGVSK